MFVPQTKKREEWGVWTSPKRLFRAPGRFNIPQHRGPAAADLAGAQDAAPLSLRPRNSRARPNTWRSVCITPVAANFASDAAPSRSAYDFNPWHGPSPLRRSIVAIVGRRRLGARREAFKEHPTKPRARSSCAKTLAQGVWRDQNPKPARPRSRREPTPGSRTRNGAPDQAATRLRGHRANSTGVPGKFSRTARIMTDAARPNAAQMPHKPSPAAFAGPHRAYRGPRQQTPGSPTRPTGAANKNYRGAGQKLPGYPTSRAGVPDKYYRVSRQEPIDKPLQTGSFLRHF